MNKFTAVAIAVIILCFGGLILWSTNNRETSKVDFSKYDPTKIIEATEDNGNIADHVRGKADSKVIVVEYADLSHVMFGGIRHEGAAMLAKKLVELTPAGLDYVFFADSGSVGS